MTFGDPSRLCTLDKRDGRCCRSFLGLRSPGVPISNYAVFVSIGLVESYHFFYDYSVDSVHESLHVHLPDTFARRLSTLVHIGYGRYSSYLRAPFSSVTGFKFVASAFFFPSWSTSVLTSH